jgi:hypothetical protein
MGEEKEKHFLFRIQEMEGKTPGIWILTFLLVQREKNQVFAGLP